MVLLQNLLQYNKKKSAQLHLHIFHSNPLKDLLLEYDTAIPSSAAIEKSFSLGKDSLKSKSLSDERFPNAFVFERQFRVKVFQ